MKYLKSIIVFLIPSIFILAACHNDDDEIEPQNEAQIDLRDSIIGKYKVVEIIECYGGITCGECYSTKDTTISVNYGSTNSTISVLGREFVYDTAGKYYYIYNQYYLYLKDDSISSYYINGGHACGKYEKYQGRKISNQP